MPHCVLFQHTAPDLIPSDASRGRKFSQIDIAAPNVVTPSSTRKSTVPPRPSVSSSRFRPPIRRVRGFFSHRNAFGPPRSGRAAAALELAARSVERNTPMGKEGCGGVKRAARNYTYISCRSLKRNAPLFPTPSALSHRVGASCFRSHSSG